MVERWRAGYDWRTTEAMLNGWGSSKTVIDGLGIHFLHIRSPEAKATPLLLTHGWPGSILESRDVIALLTDPSSHGGDAADTFHLVIPALPGLGFSDKPSEPGWGVGRTAAAWGQLMQRFGYGERWMAHGGDWGAAVTTTLAHMRAPGLAGIHLNMVMFQLTREEMTNATPNEQKMLADAQRYDREFSGYMKLQCTRPQSIAFALADSPVGLASWIYALFQEVSDSDGKPERVIPLDHLIDDVILYWLPNSGPSSARFYWEAAQEMAKGMPQGPTPLPAGVSMFPGEQARLSQRWAEQRFEDLPFFAEASRGGHLAAMEPSGARRPHSLDLSPSSVCAGTCLNLRPSRSAVKSAGRTAVPCEAGSRLGHLRRSVRAKPASPTQPSVHRWCAARDEHRYRVGVIPLPPATKLPADIPVDP